MPEAGVRAPCGGCGCVCDDVRALPGADGALRLAGACALGELWFAQRRDDGAPLARVAGEAVPPADAIAAAAALLASASAPLVYGLAETSVEAARAAVGLADRLGALVEPAGAALDGAAGRAVALRGASTATFGELRDRSALVLIWREDPATTHPRLLERLALLPDARRRRARTLVVVDDRETATGALADVRLRWPAARDREALAALRARLAGLGDVPAPRGVEAAALDDLLARLTDAPNAALVHGAGLGAGPGGHRRALALHELVRALDRRTHAVTLRLRADAGAVGAEDVLAWQTGFAGAVDLAAGFPRAYAGHGGAAQRLAGGDVDAVLSVAADPARELPPAAAARLKEIPVVALGARATATAAHAAVAFRTAAAGVDRAGTVHRMDGVPIALHAPARSARPSDDEVLTAIDAALAEAGR